MKRHRCVQMKKKRQNLICRCACKKSIDSIRENGDFFQPVAMSGLLYSCTTCTLTKHLEKKLIGNYTKMWRSILNKSWKQFKTAVLRPLTSNLTNNSSKTNKPCWVLLEKQRWTHKIHQCRSTCNNLYSSALRDTGCQLEDQKKKFLILTKRK